MIRVTAHSLGLLLGVSCAAVAAFAYNGAVIEASLGRADTIPAEWSLWALVVTFALVSFVEHRTLGRSSATPRLSATRRLALSVLYGFLVAAAGALIGGWVAAVTYPVI